MSTTIEEKETNVEQQTTTELKEELSLVKHPLQYSWTLWYDYPKGRVSVANFDKLLKKVYTFNTVEDFWSVFNHIIQPGELPNGSNYRLFKEDIAPKWEDPQNENGGAWIVCFPKKMHHKLNEWWLDLLLATIGENFSDGEQICGVICSVRKQQDRLSIWIKEGSDDQILKIGKEFKRILGFEENNKMYKFEYQTHKDAASETKTKPKFSI